MGLRRIALCVIFSVLSKMSLPSMAQFWAGDTSISAPLYLWSTNSLALNVQSPVPVSWWMDFSQTFLRNHPQGCVIVFTDKLLSANPTPSQAEDLRAFGTQFPFTAKFTWQLNPADTERLRSAFRHVDLSLLGNFSPALCSNLEPLWISLETASEPTKVMAKVTRDLQGVPAVFALTAPLPAVTSEWGYQRRVLQENPEDQKPSGTADKPIDMQPHELSAVLVVGVVAVILFLGVSCLGGIDVPGAFEESTLPINKEF